MSYLDNDKKTLRLSNYSPGSTRQGVSQSITRFTENRQLEQGHISIIGSFFGKSVFFFITHIATGTMCWDPS